MTESKHQIVAVCRSPVASCESNGRLLDPFLIHIHIFIPFHLLTSNFHNFVAHIAISST